MAELIEIVHMEAAYLTKKKYFSTETGKKLRKHARSLQQKQKGFPIEV